MAGADTVAAPAPRVPRPAAVGGSWRRVWSLTWLMGTTEFKRRYAHSAFGYLWTILQPLSLFAILYVIVTEIVFRFRGEIADYGVLLLFNLVLFQFFATATARAIPALARGAGLVQRMSIPRIVMPLSTVLSAAFPLAINLVLVCGWMLIYGIQPMWTWLLLPVTLAALLLLTASTTMLLSALYVRYRDVGEGWPIVSRLLFYSSPILFPIEVLPGALQDAQSFNPLAPLLVEARVWFIDPEAPGWFEAGFNTVGELLPFALFALVCASGWVVFARRARRMAEEL